MNIFIKTANIFTDNDCNNGRGCKKGEECIKPSHKMFKVNIVDESYVKKIKEGIAYKECSKDETG